MNLHAASMHACVWHTVYVHYIMAHYAHIITQSCRDFRLRKIQKDYVMRLSASQLYTGLAKFCDTGTNMHCYNYLLVCLLVVAH